MNRPAMLLLLTLTPATLWAQSLMHAPLPGAPNPYTQPAPAPHPLPTTPPAPAPDKEANNTAPSQAQPPSTDAPATPQPAAAPAEQADQSAADLPPTSAMAPADGRTAYAPTADSISLFAVKPIKPRKYHKQDKIEIIINETSLQKFEQNADAKESANVNAAINAMPSFEALLTDFVLKNTSTPNARLGVSNGSNYKGQGTYERKDKFTARISAIVTDVKPNGMLVLEARETMLSDKEAKSMVLSGLCDPRDITNLNTVTSSQLANLVIKTEHSGDVKDAATKGWFPRLFDAISGN